MYPAETREMKYQIIKKCMYSVHTGTYQLMTLKYVPGTYFFHRFGTRKPTFCIGLNLVHTSTYSRKKVCTKYILREKSTYQVQTGLCLFISVSYYSMVHTGMYQYVQGMYNWSRFQMEGVLGSPRPRLATRPHGGSASLSSLWAGSWRVPWP